MAKHTERESTRQRWEKTRKTGQQRGQLRTEDAESSRKESQASKQLK
jgi:hypothetical protein